jgi:hypothetical protein
VPSICLDELKSQIQELDAQTKSSEDDIQVFNGKFADSYLINLAICDFADSNPENDLKEELLYKIKISVAFNRQRLLYLDALRVNLSYLNPRKTWIMLKANFPSSTSNSKRQFQS